MENLQRKSKQQIVLDSKFDEMKGEMNKKYHAQNQHLQKQFQIIAKKCEKIQTAISNQTEQQNALKNLVKNSNILLNKTKKQDDIKNECKICMLKSVTIALKDCGHTFCHDCANPKKIPNCPYCHKKNTGALKIYLS